MASNLPLFTLAAVFLLLSGCGVGTYKLVYDRDPQVYTMHGGGLCKIVWFGFDADSIEEAYAPPCSVIIKRKINKEK